MALIAEDIGVLDMAGLRSLLDSLRSKIDSGIIVLGSATGGKANFVASVSDDLVKRGVHAGTLIGAVAKLAGGGGGGQPQKAQAGGKDGSKVPEAISQVPDLLKQML